MIIITVMLVTLQGATLLLENITVPAYWFHSSYTDFNELWSSVNVFYSQHRRQNTFTIIGSLAPDLNMFRHTKKTLILDAASSSKP